MTRSDASLQTLSLPVEGMDCADCARHLEEALARLPGVEGVQVSFATGRMRLTAEPDEAVLRRVQETARAMGYRILLQAKGAGMTWKRYLKAWPTAAAGLLLLGAWLAGWLGVPGLVHQALLIASTGVAGLPIARKGWAVLRSTRRPDMNALMTLAALGALAIGEYAEGATVIFLFSLGELLEAFTADRARAAVRALVALTPQEATRLAPEGEERVPVELLERGDRVLVRPGERVPADGDVLEGQSTVDQSPITGESLPVPKAPGDPVFAGTINGAGALTVLVTRPASDSTLARMLHLVQEAQEQRAPSQRFVDRFARVYTPAVVAGALLVAVVPPLVGWGRPLEWLYRALVLLVIACPCALVISTPVTVVSALASAARGGILIKGGVHLEGLAGVRAVAFDKTGTLTVGRPRLIEGRCAKHLDDRLPQDCPDCLDLLAKAAALERRTTHPLASAVLEAARRLDVAERYQPADDVQHLAGLGVTGRVNGHTVKVGSHTYLHGEREETEPFCLEVERAAADGGTPILVEDLCCGQRAYGVVADPLRDEAPEAIAALKRAGVQHTVMLTGDRSVAAQRIAREVGVDEVRAELLPEQKVEAVAELLGRYGSVAMVGDGVNDAPALARATVGIAMGVVGSDAALEAADVALMGDNLRALPELLRLSRQTVSIVRQNIALSLLTKVAFLGLALAGLATLWMAVFADMGISLIVTLNGMRPLLRRTGRP
ncbi:MAG: heavy metal translocating P-type ATPase [Chloroflexia bacterium]